MQDRDLEIALDDLVRRALAEDLGVEVTPWTAPEDLIARDLTTRTAVPDGARGRATLRAKAAGVFAGGEAFARALLFIDPEAVIEAAVEDGTAVMPGDVVLHAAGSARALLVAERTCLNIVQRMSGIATITRQAVDLVEGTGARILDTRKTTPGMRALDKYAVRAGGGHNHRIGLFDEVMVKENHVDLAGRSIEEVLADIRRDVGPSTTITCEARDGDEARAAVRGGADVVLLDNMDTAALSALCPELRALARTAGRDVQLEASGGITPESLAAVARTGVDRISMGALTHSAPALDLQLPSTHAHGRMARRVARQFAEGEGLDGSECETLEFVVGELLDNAVDHGGGGAARELEDLERDVTMHLVVEVVVGDGETRWAVRVEDQGGGEPEEVRRMIAPESGFPDLEDERGRGFFLLAQMVDALDVDLSGDGKGLRLEARRTVDGRAAG